MGVWSELRSDDDTLVARVRDGDAAAYDRLFERHHRRARRVARAVVDDAGDVDDVVSEAFAAVLAALKAGKGPTDGFAGYLTSAVRHEAWRTNRRRQRRRPIAEPADEPAAEPAASPEDTAVLRAAFESLPGGARDLLWRTEVEGRSHAEIAELVGTTSQAVATRAARARDALGGAYLAGHLGFAFDEPPPTSGCSDARDHLVALVRGTASPRRRRAVEDHLAGCESCRGGRDRLAQLNERLRTSPLAEAVAASGSFGGALGGGTLLARFAAVLGPMATTTAIASVAAASVATVALVGPTWSEPMVPDAVVSEAPVEAAAAEVVATTVAAPAGVAATGSPLPVVAQDAADIAEAIASGLRSATTIVPVPDLPDLPALPGVTVPGVTVPGVTVPGVTVPGVTLPGVTAPDATLPVTIPGATVPVTIPGVTAPVTIPPATTLPSLPLPTTPVTTVPPLTVPPLPGP